MDDLHFQNSPTVKFCTNYFLNVKTLLQYDDTPLIAMTGSVSAGFETEFRIFNQDGVYIAKVTGSRLFLTPDGEKSNLELRHPDKMTVCELDGKTLFEVSRTGPAALSTEAELFTPDGAFLRCAANPRPDIIKGEQNMLHPGHLHQAEVAHAGSRIDQDVVVEQK